MKYLTEEILYIFWSFQDKSKDNSNRTFQEEVPGVLAYGYWEKGKLGSLSFPYTVWPQGTVLRRHFLTGENWEVLEWKIRIDEWPKPDAWCDVLKETLQVMHKNGAKVAWFGRDNHFADPPYLFSPHYMTDSVYAVYFANQFVCAAHLGKPYESISDDLLLALHALIP